MLNPTSSLSSGGGKNDLSLLETYLPSPGN